MLLDIVADLHIVQPGSVRRTQFDSANDQFKLVYVHFSSMPFRSPSRAKRRRPASGMRGVRDDSSPAVVPTVLVTKTARITVIVRIARSVIPPCWYEFISTFFHSTVIFP